MVEFVGLVQTENSFLAALMASLIAHCAEDARRSGGSPDAGKIQSVCQSAIVGELKLHYCQFSID
jgi:hypothetical protein